MHYCKHRNQLGNIHAFNEGVGHVRGQLWMPMIDYAQSGNFGGVAMHAFQVDELIYRPQHVVRRNVTLGESSLNSATWWTCRCPITASPQVSMPE
jgi:hypothetical protein